MVKALKASEGGVLVYAECGGTEALCRIYCAEHGEKTTARPGKRKLPYLLVRELFVQISQSHRAGERSDGLSLLPR